MNDQSRQQSSAENNNPRERKNPYVGPRPYEFGEILFGRDRETRDLFDQLISERIVLLHSPSGAGKTSLVMAGLLPMLEQEGFDLLPVIRVGDELQMDYTEPDKFNRYIYSLLLALDSKLPKESKTHQRTLVGMSFPEYLSLHLSEEDSQPRLFIFDQFEEIITASQGDQPDKEIFFEQVGEVLRNRNRWALFIIRDDFLGALEPYALSIPTQFTNTFRLDFLESPAALQAIQKPLELQGVDFLDSAAHKLVDDLRTAQFQTASGDKAAVLGDYVEPVQLQVVCLRLYDKLGLASQLNKNQINDQDIANVGDVDQALAQYYAERVAAVAPDISAERSIRNWFDNKLITKSGLRNQVMMEHEVSGGLDNTLIRSLENEHLVRAEKRRGVTWFELAHDRLVQPVLEDNDTWRRDHLSLLQLRATEWQGNNHPDGLLLRGKEFEKANSWAVSHQNELEEIDKKLLEASLKWRLAHLSPLQRQALEWDNQGRPSRRLLREEELEQAGMWATTHIEEISSREQEFLEASRKAAEKTARDLQKQELRIEYERRRADEQTKTAAILKKRAVALGIATIAAISMFVMAMFFANSALETANTNATLAAKNAAFGNAQSTLAAEEAAIAQARSTQAAESNAIADSQSTMAADREAQAAVNAQIALTSMAEEAIARSDKATAVYNEKLAFSRQLASQSISFLDRKPDLGTLLSISAYQVDPSIWYARHALLTSLQTGLDQTVQAYAVMIPSTIDITNDVDISSDGKTIAWSGSDGRIILWDVAQKKNIRELQDPTGEKITAQAFSPRDPNLLVTGSEKNAITFWDLRDGSFERKEATVVDVDGRYILGRIRHLDFNPDGGRLAVQGQGRFISVWDVNTHTQITAFKDDASFYWKLAWSPNGNYLAAAGADNYLYIFDPRSGKAIDYERNPGGEGEIYALDWLPDSKQLVFSGRTGHQYARVYFYDIATMKVLPNYLQSRGSTTFDLSFGVDGNLLVLAGRNEPVYVWDISDGEELAHLTEYGNFQNGLAFKKNLLAYIGSNTISVYEMAVPEPLSQELSSVTGEVLALGAQLQGDLWIASQSGRNILLQQRKNGESETYRPGTTLPSSVSLVHLHFSPEGPMMFAGDQMGDIIQWNPSTGETNTALSGLSTPITSLAVSPDGSTLAASYCADPAIDQPEDVCISHIQLWDLSSQSAIGQPINTSQGMVTSLTFSPDGSILASGSQNGTILLIDTLSGEPVGLPLGDFSVNVSSMAYSPDGVILAAGTDDGQLFLWDVKAKQVLGKPFRVGNDRLAGLAFSQDGLILYSATSFGQLAAWDMDYTSWEERACRIAGRNFTPEEWRQYFPDREYSPTCPELSQVTPTPTP